MTTPKPLPGRRWATAAGLLFCAALAQAAPVVGQGTWGSTLQARSLAGNGTVDAYYDTATNLTWLASPAANGPMSWEDAVAWAAGLTLGGGTWRLPTVTGTAATGCVDSPSGTNCGFNVDTSTSELAYLYHVTLGNASLFDTSGNLLDAVARGSINTGVFSGLGDDYTLWTGQADTVGTGLAGDVCEQANTCAYFFDFGFGAQEIEAKSNAFYALAVHDGDIGSAPSVPTGNDVPEPATWALVGGALALLRVRNRKGPCKSPCKGGGPHLGEAV
jgi:hypothetical protein